MKKFPKKFFYEIFEQCHSAEKCKRGTRCYFLTSILFQISKQMKGGPSGAIQKTSKKVLKKSGAKVCFRGCGRLLCFFFSFWTRF